MSVSAFLCLRIYNNGFVTMWVDLGVYFLDRCLLCLQTYGACIICFCIAVLAMRLMCPVCQETSLLYEDIETSLLYEDISRYLYGWLV